MPKKRTRERLDEITEERLSKKADLADVTNHDGPSLGQMSREERHEVLYNGKPKYIISDVDETVLSTTARLIEYCDKKVGKKSKVSSLIDVGDAYDLTDEEADALLDAFWTSGEMGKLEPLHCAKEVLPRLHAAGWEFVGITACSDAPEVVRQRKQNLENAFGFEWKEVHHTGFRGNKADYLARYHPAIWVEDHFQNAIAGGMLGHKTFLIDAEHNFNMEHGYVQRVKNWHEIEKYILENNL